MALLEVRSIYKSYGDTSVLADVSFRMDEGEILCLLGPSGCGKTTLLRIIAGLETAEAGEVICRGRSLEEVPVHRRGFGLMFQDYALFPHKDVAANVAFGLRMQSQPASQVAERVSEMLALVGLEGYQRRRVYDLSGGEQQRVALARSLAPGPGLLMLDEPLGSLDRALREELMNELRTILKEVSVAAIYVTHDQQEAFALADRVLVMRQGRVVQRGTPQAVYRQPVSSWVARFLGLSNLVPGRVVGCDPLEVDSPLGRLTLPTADGVVEGSEVTLLIRPEAARLAEGEVKGGQVRIAGAVRRCSFRGSHYLLEIEHEAGLDLGFELIFRAEDLPRRGERVVLSLRPEGISLLAEEMDENAKAG